MKTGFNTTDSFLFDGAPTTPVGANLICRHSTTVDGGMALAGAGDMGVCGVTMEATNPNGYAGVQLFGTAQVVVGASTVTHGDWVMADASGKATTATPHAAGGGTYTGVLGKALNTSTTGNLVSVHIMPQSIYV